MMEHNTFWSKVVGRITSLGTSNGNGLDVQDKEDERSPGEARKIASGVDLIEAPASIRNNRRGRTELNPAKLQDGYDKVLDLVESIQKHMSASEARTQQVVDALDRLATNLSHLPSATATQTETLTSMVSMLDNAAAKTTRLHNELAVLPELTRAQQETDARVLQTLQGVSESIVSLSEATSKTSSVLGRYQTQADEADRRRETRLVELIERQNRRFAWVMLAMIVVALILGGAVLLR